MLTTLKKTYYLGIDGGATKTEAVIADESGFVLGRGLSEGSNPHNIGIEKAFAHIFQAVSNARADVRDKHPDRIFETFSATCLGLAGLDTDYDRTYVSSYLHSLPASERTFGSDVLLLVDDGYIGLKAGTNQDWGICLVSGTGSSCYGMSAKGKEASAGHWGYLLGDQGSSFAIGQSILKLVFKEYDGRLAKSVLTQKVLGHFHCTGVPELIKLVYLSPTIPVREIAGLSTLCNDVALSDLIEVSEIINHAIRELIEAYKAIVQRLSFDIHQEFTVVLNGGMFELQGPFSQMVIRSILHITPRATIIFATRTPAEGAIRVAHLANFRNMLPASTLIFLPPSSLPLHS